MLRTLYLFNDYVLDPAARELRSPDGLVTLPATTFDCLTWLIEHRDRAVGRDELIAAVWGRADISDAQLAQVMLKARRAVGDSGEDQQIIRTIPRFGYRWIAPVDVVQETLAEAESDAVTAAVIEADVPTRDGPPDDRPSVNPGTAPPPPQAPAAPAAATGATAGRRTSIGLPVAVIAAVAIAALIWWLRPEPPVPAPAANASATPEMVPNPARTVVLPAQIQAPADWEWLDIGLMELIANRLMAAGIQVVPSENVMSLARGVDTPDPARIQAAVDAGRFVVASARLSRGRWQVRLQGGGGDGPLREVEAEGADPMAAAHEAAIRLLAAQGSNVRRDLDVSEADGLLRASALMMAGKPDEARRQLESLPPALRQTPEFRLRSAQVDFAAGEFQRAYTAASELLASMEPDADPTLRARVLNALAASAIRLGRAEDAGNASVQVLALVPAGGNHALRGQAHLAHGVSLAMRSQFEQAIDAFGRARIELTSAGDTLALARLASNEGALQGDQGYPAQALHSFRDAEEKFRRMGARDELASAMGNQILAHLELLEYAEAMRVSEQASELVPLLENPAAQEAVAMSQARAMIASGQLTRARVRLDDILDGEPARRSHRLRATAQAYSAVVHGSGGRFAEAVRAAQALVRDDRQALSADTLTRTWLTLLRAHIALGQIAEAQAVLTDFQAWAENSAHRLAPMRLSLAQAELAQADGEVSTDHFNAAMQLADRKSVPAEVAEVASRWGEALVANRQLDEASATIGRIARWAPVDFDCALAQAGLYRALDQEDAWRAALEQARLLAGERPLPATLSQPLR